MGAAPNHPIVSFFFRKITLSTLLPVNRQVQTFLFTNGGGGGWGEQVIQMTMLAVEVVNAWEAFVLCPLSAGPEGGEILWPASLTYTPVWILFEARRAEIS